MFKISIASSNEEASETAFEIIRSIVTENPQPVLGLATGSSPVGLYQKMIEAYKKGLSYRSCITFNLDEYVGIDKNHEQSYYTFMHENLFNGIDIPGEQIHIPCGSNGNEEQACRDYEEEISRYTVDVQVLGIGSDGHIAFNEPETPFDSVTHIMPLTEQTRKDNARFFGGNIDLVPKTAITQGLATIMRAKKIVLIATGNNKAQAVYDTISGPVTVDCPASILQRHPDVTVILDQEAASKLK